jgi:hypothetical protein
MKPVAIPNANKNISEPHTNVIVLADVRETDLKKKGSSSFSLGKMQSNKALTIKYAPTSIPITPTITMRDFSNRL